MNNNIFTTILILAVCLSTNAYGDAHPSCTGIDTAFTTLSHKALEMKVYTNANRLKYEVNGDYPAAALVADQQSDIVMSKLSDIESHIPQAITGYYIARAYNIHSIISDINRSLWTIQHWSAISYIYDKDVDAYNAVSFSVNVTDLTNKLHKLSLDCYLHMVPLP